MDFFRKKDYLNISIFGLTGLGFMFAAKEAYDSILVEALASMIGFPIGYILANYTSTQSKKLRIAVLGAIILLSSLSIYLINVANSQELPLQGMYMTDSSDGFVVKLNAEKSKVFLSMSPDFKEVEYQSIFRNDSLLLYKENKLIFGWEVLEFDKEQLVIGDSSGEKLKFVKQD